MNTKEIYTIELISQKKEEKRAEIQASQKRMQHISQELFSPTRSDNKIDSMMQHINMGIAAYDGIMTGIKVLRRIQNFFSQKRK